MPADYNIRAVDRALAVLDCFDVDHSSYSLKEIAEKIELTPSTTLRLLCTLENRNYVYRNSENNRYYLGARLAQLGNAIFTNMDICVEAQPFLQELSRKYNESVGIYERHGDQRVCITRINSRQTLRSVMMVGATYSLTRGASGRVLLAYMPEEDQLRLLAEDPFTTPEQLTVLREAGYTISQGERDSAVESIAAPVFDVRGNAADALFMTGPAGRFANYDRSEMVRDVCEAARRLSIQMGYRP